MSPILVPYILFRSVGKVRHQNGMVVKFSEDLQCLLAKVGVQHGDLVFIPTLGEVELGGASLCVERLPVEISWHYLFRRNIFEGREPSYQAQLSKVEKLQQALFSYRTKCAASRSWFYTDTDALTEQYNGLGIVDFQTLPIPLDDALKKRDDLSGPLKISYIGDARDEKGFPLLSRLVGDLKAAGYGFDDVVFVLQSNFNVPGGEAASRISKAELATESPDLVQFVEGPFESDEYTRLVNESDIVLVPYSQANYYARSSGIFAEALAAGVPVVASDKTWMSQEMRSFIDNYYRDLLRKSQVLQTVRIASGNAHSQVIVRPKTDEKYCWLIVEVNQLRPNPGHYLRLTWRASPVTILRADREANFLRNFSIDLRVQQAIQLVKVPARDRLLLHFNHDDGMGIETSLARSPLRGVSIAIHELKAIDGPLYPGVAFYSYEEDFAAAVAEVINDHQAYVKHSVVLRESWCKFHSSEYLVSRLTGNTP